MTEPNTLRCAWCMPEHLRGRPRPGEVAQPMILCPKHQRLMDRMNDVAAAILVPAPAGDEPSFAGIVTSSGSREPAPPLTVEDLRETIRKLTGVPEPRTLEEALAVELSTLHFPIGQLWWPVQLPDVAARLADVARRWLERRPESTSTEYGVVWLTEGDGICLTADKISTIARARETGREKVGTLGIAGYRIESRTHYRYNDGSVLITGWTTVDDPETTTS